MQLAFDNSDPANNELIQLLGSSQLAGQLVNLSVYDGVDEPPTLDTSLLLHLLQHPEGSQASCLLALELGPCTGDLRSLLAAAPNLVSLELDQLPEGVALQELIAKLPALRNLRLYNSDRVTFGSQQKATELLTCLQQLTELGIG